MPRCGVWRIEESYPVLKMSDRSRNAIRSICLDRDVTHLLHFTQIANLQGIVRYGLLSRRDLAKVQYPVFGSNDYRLDGNDDAVSVSVSRTNQAMFTSKRHGCGYANWTVLVLPAEILWTHECRFCWSNAARKNIRNYRGWRGGPWALSKMFAGDEVARLGLPDNYPTNPEAEVQVMQPISPSYILGAVVNEAKLVRQVEHEFSSLPKAKLPVIVGNFDVL